MKNWNYSRKIEKARRKISLFNKNKRNYKNNIKNKIDLNKVNDKY